MDNSIKDRKLYENSAVIVAALCMVFLAILFSVSIFRTVVYADDVRLGEYMLSEVDSGFFNIILLTVMACASYLVYRVCEHIDFKLLNALMLLWILFWGFMFVYSASRVPEGDAELIANTAFLSAGGNYSVMAEYLNQNPFGVGLAFYEELLIRFLKIGFPDISKGYCFMALQLVNVFLLAVSALMLVELGGILFGSKDVQKLLSLFLMLFVPVYLGCTAVNGKLAAFSFSVAALLFFVLYSNKRKIWFVLISAVCMGISLSMKLDALVVLAAIILVWLICVAKERKTKAFIAFSLFAFTTVSVSVAPLLLHSYRSEGNALSSVTTLREAMGFDETERGNLIYSGMYSAVNYNISGVYEIEKKTEHEDIITEFYRQWNEPQFGSIHSNKNSNHYRETGRLYNFVCNSGEKLISMYLNLFQSFLLGGAVISMVRLMRERQLFKLLPAIVLLGGVVLHLIFPAESSYAMKYYLIMLPLSAHGYWVFFERFWAKQDRNSENG